MRLPTCLAALALTLAAALPAPAAFTLTYDFAGQPGDQVSTSGLIVGTAPIPSGTALVRGPGLTANVGGNSMNSVGFTTGGIDLADYYGFSLTAPAGSAVKLASLAVTERRSAFGPTGLSVRTSVDGFAADVFATALQADLQTHRLTIDLSAVAASAGPVTVRIYGYGAVSEGGALRLGVSAFENTEGAPANLVVAGSVVTTATPAPAGVLVLAAAAGLLGLARRLRA